MLPVDDVIQLYSHAAVFCCPSVYEPFGIINLEAMACETPVVASAVGGILEVVEDGVTGLLVPPRQPRELAAALNAVLGDPGARAGHGEGRAEAGRGALQLGQRGRAHRGPLRRGHRGIPPGGAR